MSAISKRKPLTGYERVVLEHILHADAQLKGIQDQETPVVMRHQLVTKIETYSKTRTSDSGNEEMIVKAFTEKDACLFTITSWDTIKDKETFLRTQIFPSLIKLNLKPEMTILLQFLDSMGKPMRHEPTTMPKVLRQEPSK